MRVRVDEIPQGGRTLHFHWDDGQLKQHLPPRDPFDVTLAKPLNVDLEIDKLTDHIRIEGKVRGTLGLTCHRCLKGLTQGLDEAVNVFLYEQQKAPAQEETQLEADELNYEFFDGEVIDIDQLVLEQILLGLPVKVLCSEECLGLCPRCGANLNDESCGCAKKPKDSPFAKLEAIRQELPNPEDLRK
ncbi:MAG TPA: DUF177 domain-containing protein [Syntrophobacteraceae bacterium]|nr:DUF177 domain-containing protein [Syntrophobacteraceae bacterium]